MHWVHENHARSHAKHVLPSNRYSCWDGISSRKVCLAFLTTQNKGEQVTSLSLLTTIILAYTLFHMYTDRPMALTPNLLWLVQDLNVGNPFFPDHVTFRNGANTGLVGQT